MTVTEYGPIQTQWFFSKFPFFFIFGNLKDGGLWQPVGRSKSKNLEKLE